MTAYHTFKSAPLMRGRPVTPALSARLQASTSQSVVTAGSLTARTSGARGDPIRRHDSHPLSTKAFADHPERPERTVLWDAPVPRNAGSAMRGSAPGSGMQPALHQNFLGTSGVQEKASPRRQPAHVPTCSIDGETEVPEDLFHSLMRHGKDRRKAGQHVLVSRSEKSGGGVKLVHPERIAKAQSKSTTSLMHLGHAGA